MSSKHEPASLGGNQTGGIDSPSIVSAVWTYFKIRDREMTDTRQTASYVLCAKVYH